MALWRIPIAIGRIAYLEIEINNGLVAHPDSYRENSTPGN